MLVEVNDATGGWLKIATFDGDFKNYVRGEKNNRRGRDLKQFVEGPCGWVPGPCVHTHTLCCGGIEQTPSAVADCASRWESDYAKGRLGLQLGI